MFEHREALMARQSNKKCSARATLFVGKQPLVLQAPPHDDDITFFLHEILVGDDNDVFCDNIDSSRTVCGPIFCRQKDDVLSSHGGCFQQNKGLGATKGRRHTDGYVMNGLGILSLSSNSHIFLGFVPPSSTRGWYDLVLQGSRRQGQCW
jgi:hypothetical protein